jgi:hypothetical protein
MTVCLVCRDDVLIIFFLQYIISHVTIGDFACCSKSKLRCYKVFLTLQQCQTKIHGTVHIAYVS